MTTRQLAVRATAVGLVLGVGVGALMMRLAWIHNAQGEIHEAGRVDWGYWLLIGVSWALPVAVATGGMAWLVLRATHEPPPG